MKVKKIVAIGLIGILIITSTGCSAKENKLVHDVVDTLKDKAKSVAQDKLNDFKDWATENAYVDPETENLLNQASVVMESFQSKDEDSLFMLFNEYMRKNYKEDLERDIKGAFDFIDGDIVSYDEPSIEPSTQKTDENGIIKDSHEIWIDNIRTDKGKKYEIKFKTYDVNKKYKEGLGIEWFAIIEGDLVTKTGKDLIDDMYNFGPYGDTYDAVLNW